MSMSAAPAGKGRRRRAAMADINVTPLVDVMLVLLVIFMITAPVLKDGIDVDLPKAQGGTSGGKSAAPLSIIIDKEGIIHYAGRKMNQADVGIELPKLLKGHEKEPLTLKGDLRLSLQVVVRVMAIVRQAGITTMSIAVEKD